MSKPSNIPSNTASNSALFAAQVPAGWMRPAGGFFRSGDALIYLGRLEQYRFRDLEQPLPALFWSASADEEGVVRLASACGWLSADHMRPILVPDRFSDWVRAVKQARLLRLCLDFYEQPKKIKPFLFGDNFECHWNHAEQSWEPGVPEGRGKLSYVTYRVPEKSLPRIAAYVLTTHIGFLLQEIRLTARLEPPAVATPHLEAGSLLGIVALEVLALATGQRRYQLCAECGRLFDKTDLRADALYHPECSKRRRMREYMRRRRQRQEGDNDE